MAKFTGSFKVTGSVKLFPAPPPFPLLTGTGDTGRCISLIGTNGLVSGSYTASSTYVSDSPAGAFDGYGYGGGGGVGKINSAAGSRVARGIWMTASGQITNQWLRVDFGQPATISQMRFRMTSGVGATVQPKDVRVEYSSNGSDWTIHQTLTTPSPITSAFQTVTLTTYMVTPRYFRLYCLNNWGDSSFLGMDELELLQPEY